MAETFDNLYSVGAGAVGPGLSVVRALGNPQRERAVITRIFQSDTAITPTQLGTLYSVGLLPFYPGTAIPLDHTVVKQLSDTLALVVARYGMRSGRGGFRRVFTSQTSGFRDLAVYNVSDAYTGVAANYVGGDTENRLLPDPDKARKAPIITIQHSEVVYQDARPSEFANQIGTVNASAKQIDGYSYAAESLRYDGAKLTHDKYGAYDRWTILRAYSWEPNYRWRVDAVERGDIRIDGSYEWSKVNNGDGVQPYPTSNFTQL